MKKFKDIKKQINESVWDTYRKKALSEERLLDVPTHSIEDIAKKHGVSVETIESQLKKGIDVEKEHTTHPDVAREIALDHLGEKPDYYTKLDKADLEEDINSENLPWYKPHHNASYSQGKVVGFHQPHGFMGKLDKHYEVSVPREHYEAVAKQIRKKHGNTPQAAEALYTHFKPQEGVKEELTPRERMSSKERLTPEKPKPVDANMKTKKTLTQQKKTTENARKTMIPTKPVLPNINEAYEQAFNEDGGSLVYKVGDRVIPKIGPHAGQVHRVIHVYDTGHMNIKPEHTAPARNKYRLGAARAHPEQVIRAPLPEAKDWSVRGVNCKTIQEVFKSAKDKKNGKAPEKKDDAPDEKKGKNPFAKKDALPDAGANEPNKEVPGTPPPQDAGATPASDNAPPKPGAEKKDNTPTPEKKTGKITVKGPGPDDKFQADPIVTPVTTMPDTASPKSGSQGVR
jgi:hypothetical protein